MKNKLYLAIVTIVAATLTGCSSTPRVIVDVVEQLPSLPAEKVMVYETDESVPRGAKPIGKVNIMEGVMTPAEDCLYVNMLSLAVKKTAEYGGNALHVDDHKLGGLTSKCHRIWGTMYVLPDSLVTSDAPSVISRLEEQKDLELLEMARKQTDNKKNTPGYPNSILKINVGPSWLMSDFIVGSTTYEKLQGFSLNANYQHLWRSGLGFGVNYRYNTTSFGLNSSIKLHYIGPSFVGSIKFGRLLRADAAFGLGYGSYSENSNINSYDLTNETLEKSGLGYLYQLGIELMATKHVGLGLQFNAFIMKLKRPERFDTEKYDFYGVKQLDALIGLRFYL